jgi:hypothetical protein
MAMQNHLNGNPQIVKQFVRTATPTQRALETAELCAVGYSFRRARRMTGASYGYASTAVKLSVEQRELVRRGSLSLAQFHAAPPVSDKTIDRFIAKAGADRVMAALDRFTTPPLIAAE